ncbi:hypothetical protein DH2020_047875 [Rehmannia glutinosa]|uniref:Uncharacterized protein n=1 Tax=Rehmannia glutinosa TaxID=99300 RepID=A0ABR0U7M8_REHGL
MAPFLLTSPFRRRYRRPLEVCLPNLAPGLEDYSKIFGGFHASRSFSIPMLDLLLIGDDFNLHFDARTSGFDYTEVFGDSGGVALASFEDIVGQSSGGYDSSDEPWSPTQSESLSDEFDRFVGSEKSHSLSDVDVHQSMETIKQFSASYNKSSKSNMETVLTGTSHTNFSALSGYTFSHNESPISGDGEDDENCPVSVIDDLNHCKEYGGRVIKDKHYNKWSTNPLSRLPPPSRPPSALLVEKGECDRSNPKLKASKSYAFERVTDDSAPLSFDVEVCATLPVGGRENGNKNVKVKQESTRGSIERKYIRSHSAMQAEKKTSQTARGFDMVEDCDTLMQHMNRDAYRHRRTIGSDTFSLQEDRKKLKVSKEA